MRRSRTVRRGLVAAATMVTAASLVACGGTNNAPDAAESPDVSPGTGESAPSTPETDPDAVLRYMYYKSPGSFDPHKATSGFDNAPLFLVYDRLVHQSPTGEAVPGLATEWTFSDDVRTLTMTLREDVTFHDGTPFDAEAVKANIERAKTVEGSAVASEMTNIETVDVIDEHTVALNLTKPAVSTPLLLSDRAGAMISPAALDAPDLGVHPVGAGMYQVSEDYQTGVSISLARYDDYWDPEANLLAGVEIDFNADATARLNAVRTDAADVAGINPDQIEQAESAGLDVVSGFDLTFGTLTFNPDLLPALQDERVRLAINLAIDRQAIVDGIFFGEAVPASQPFPEGYFAHSDEAADYEYDLDRAKALMAEAGWEDGFDVVLRGVPDPIRTRTGEAVAGQLAEINIRAEVVPTESNVQAQMYITDKTAPAQNNAWSGRADPALTLAPNYLAGGWQNPGNLTSDEVTRLFEEAEAEPDLEARTALLQQLSAELVEHPLSIVALYRPKTSVVAVDGVVGLQSWISGKTEFRGVGMTAS